MAQAGRTAGEGTPGKSSLGAQRWAKNRGGREAARQAGGGGGTC